MSKLTKARRDYACVSCGRHIYPGDMYFRTSRTVGSRGGVLDFGVRQPDGGVVYYARRFTVTLQFCRKCREEQ